MLTDSFPIRSRSRVYGVMRSTHSATGQEFRFVLAMIVTKVDKVEGIVEFRDARDGGCTGRNTNCIELRQPIGGFIKQFFETEQDALAEMEKRNAEKPISPVIVARD